MTPPNATVPPQNPPISGATNPDLDLGGFHPAGQNPTALPKGKRGRVPVRLLTILGILLATASAVAGVWAYVRSSATARPDLILHAVTRERLSLTIVERGQLEAANNEDIICRVKAGAKGSTVATTIKWVVDDGTQVKKGDLLVVLDDSGMQEQLKTQDITVRQAEAAKIKAEEDYSIAESENASLISTAETNLALAILDLKKYEEGDYEQKKKDIDGRILIARSDRLLWRDRVFFSERMVKGKYITEAQLLADKARLKSADVAVEKAEEELRVLREYDYVREMTRLKNEKKDKEEAVERVKKQANSKRVQAEAERTAKQKIHEQEASRFKEIEEQITLCRVYAPQEGLVVYYVPEQSRFGSGSRQSIIAQGEPVVEGQKLMRIPNLSHMLVNTKVHEALVSRVRPGQPAKVRVDAFPERDFRATVKSVATVAAQQDWMATDVKVYQTMVSIEEDVESLGLKPGMSGAVTIYTDSRSEDALTIPIQAVVGGFEMGRSRKCFVVTADGPQEREVVVGISNEKMVEIKDGVKEGEQVVLNPRALMSDKDRKLFGGSDRLLGKDNGPPGGWPKAGEGGAPMKGGPEGGKGSKGGRGGPPGGPGGAPGEGRGGISKAPNGPPERKGTGATQ